jgi:hypothetical protein
MESGFNCNVDEYPNIVSMIKGVIQARCCNDQKSDEISFKKTHIGDDQMEVTMSGYTLPYFMCSDRAEELGAYIKSVSMGSSTMNVTVIDHSDLSGHNILPVRFGTNIMTSLTADSDCNVNGMEFWPEIKKVVIKFRRVSGGKIVGPSLTIGCNGGFQWIGTSSMLSSTLVQAFTHMSTRMDGSKFVRAVSSSDGGPASVYPSGVPKNLDR